MAVARSFAPRQPNPEFGDLVQIALDVAGSLKPREVITRILERAIDALQADRATLSSINGNEIVVEATSGRRGSVTWFGQRYSVDYFAGQPLVKKAMDTLRPAFGGQLALDTAAPEFREALAGVKHVAALPLVHGGRAMGLLVLSRYRDEPFSATDQPALILIGAISGLALRNARLYEEVAVSRREADETAGRLRIAVDAAQDVAEQTELRQVLIRLLQGACKAVAADGASLGRLDGTHMVLESTISGEGVGTRWPLAPKVLAGIRRGRPVELPAAEYSATPQGLEPIVQPYCRFLVAPLVAGGESIGLLAMGRKEDHAFDPQAIESLQQFSTLGALLLRNARLISQAQDAERAKSEFMSVAVHELRAPLTVMSGYLGMVLEGGFGELPKAMHDVLQIAMRKSEEAKVMADELLTVARLEGRVIKPEAHAFSVEDAVGEALSRARPRAELLGASITADVSAQLQANADRTLVSKILDNLINNALAYSQASPEIRITAQREDDQVVILVADNGIGIHPEDLDRIFVRFARGTDRRVLEKPGTGLGLYLSRGLAEQMSGSLELEKSEPGEGSSFALRLPAAAR